MWSCARINLTFVESLFEKCYQKTREKQLGNILINSFEADFCVIL